MGRVASQQKAKTFHTAQSCFALLLQPLQSQKIPLVPLFLLPGAENVHEQKASKKRSRVRGIIFLSVGPEQHGYILPTAIAQKTVRVELNSRQRSRPFYTEKIRCSLAAAATICSEQ